MENNRNYFDISVIDIIDADVSFQANTFNLRICSAWFFFVYHLQLHNISLECVLDLITITALIRCGSPGSLPLINHRPPSLLSFSVFALNKTQIPVYMTNMFMSAGKLSSVNIKARRKRKKISRSKSKSPHISQQTRGISWHKAAHTHTQHDKSNILWI